MKKIKKSFLLLLCVLSSCFVLTSLVFAASNKAVRVKTTFPAIKGDSDDSQHVMFGGVQKTKCKATKSMKLSCTLYIPEAAFGKDTFFSFDPMVGLETTKKYYGTIFGKYRVHLQSENGKMVFRKETDDGLGAKLSAKTASIKKKNGFYVIALKNLPLCSWAFDWTPDKKIKINTSKNFKLLTYIRVFRHSGKKWSGAVYADNLTLRAGKTLKMTFDKKDYSSVFAYKFVEEKVTASVAVVK